MDENNQYNMPETNVEGNAQDASAGKGTAIASLVLGIVSILSWFIGIGAIIGLVTGVIGLVCASKARKAGYKGGMQVAGFVCSIIGVVGSALVFISCVACVGALGTAGTAELLNSL